MRRSPTLNSLFILFALFRVRERRHDVIFPAPGYHEIVARVAFYVEAQAAKHLCATLVARHVVSHDAVQAQFVEDVTNGCRQGFVHQPMTYCILVQHVTEKAGMERAAYEVRKVARANDALFTI